MTVLDGNPAERGTFIARLKMPAGYKIMPHTHPVAERVTVISGTLFIAIGDKLDGANARKLGPGDFVVFPKGSKHSAWAIEECVIQLQSEGPFDMEYVNAADDPRKQNK
jgi:quercetin dioxygenase-like cupin family protein